MKISVLIVEDEVDWLDLYFQELRRLENIEITGAVTTIEKAVELVKNKRPDIILMDLNLSKGKFEGITGISEILQDIDTKIIVVTSHFDKTLVEEAFNAGAVEYLLKHHLKRLPEVIKEVYENTSPHVVLANKYLHHRKECQFNTLSKTEKEILQLKKQGFTHTEIEKMSYKARSTLKHQVGSLLKKLNVSSCHEAVKKFKQFID
jgi:DNA-binding NarL/FixJ family response regulator